MHTVAESIQKLSQSPSFQSRNLVLSKRLDGFKPHIPSPRNSARTVGKCLFTVYEEAMFKRVPLGADGVLPNELSDGITGVVHHEECLCRNEKLDGYLLPPVPRTILGAGVRELVP